jgi:hypothetical protein
MKSKIGEAEEHFQPKRLRAAASATRAPSLTKLAGQHSADKQEMSMKHLMAKKTHVDLFNSFQTHQVFSPLFCFPFLRGCFRLHHCSGCFSNLGIQ